MVGVAAEGKCGYVALDGGAALGCIHPVRDEAVVGLFRAVPREVEESGPRIATVVSQGLAGKGARHVLADSMALVAVHPPFALLEIDGIGWQVPVHHSVTVGVV